ncbi:hypothetical protein [Rhodopila sp.]|uniref:hypothetical protein n=1 Tax=Rhodopila sp. TaxID=2480087 RepID=UPI003D0F7B14
MLRFTLDTNCVIDVDEGRPNSVFVTALAQAHSDQRANVAVVAMMASEKQKTGGYLASFTDFMDRLTRLGLSHLDLALPLCYLDISYLDHCLLSDVNLTELDNKIHRVLFSSIDPNYTQYCQSNGIDPNNAISGQAHRWRNAKCDVQALWSHINRKADVFVTSDRNFLGVNMPRLIALGAGRVLTPEDAVGVLT